MGETLGLPEFTWFMNSKFDRLADDYLYCGREVRRAVEAYDPWASDRDLYWDVINFPTDLSILSKRPHRKDVAYDAMMRNEILHTVGLAGMEEFSLLGMAGYGDNTILRHEIKRNGACVGVLESRKFVRDDGHELIVHYDRDPTRKDGANEMLHCVRVLSPLIGILVADGHERRIKGRPMEATLGTERWATLNELQSLGWTGDARFMLASKLRLELLRLKLKRRREEGSTE